MLRFCVTLIALFSIALRSVSAVLTPEQVAQLPAPASHKIDFAAEVKPIFESSCIKCHGRGKDKGGFRLDNRETFLKGGDSGPVIVTGKSAESLLISLVQGFDPDSVMPKKGSRLTAEQIGIIRAWIDQGAVWDPAVGFGRVEPLNLKPQQPQLPPGSSEANPIDRLLEPYFTAHKIKPGKPVNDRLYARRVYLDIVGLLPPPDELEAFLKDRHADKRKRLVERLLADDRNYAEHWLTFWNDLLRNDYKGTGYIDGGRKQITGWLYSALLTNMPYNQFVAQLINPSPESEGFTKGIVWRGVVNASQTPQMQAAQSICQVFMGVNLKCASCHDSFVNDLTLADAYGLAGVYADGPLEMVQCDKPTGKKADLHFIYPELGAMDPKADKPARLKRLAEIISGPQDGRLARTFVNRLWQRLFGRGLVEPVDDMEKAAWSPELLDWLAEDFAGHNHNVKFLIERILTSRAYQLPSTDFGNMQAKDFVFSGPGVRRMSAEQFRDAISSLTQVGYASPAAEVASTETEAKKFSIPIPVRWIWSEKDAAEKAKPGHIYFRRKITLSAVPADASGVAICDNSFMLFVNGHKVGAGSDFKAAYLFDLRPWLKPGENIFAVDAVNNSPDNKPPDPKNVSTNSYNPAGFLFYARLRDGKGKLGVTNDFASDDSWVWTESPAADWKKLEFAETGWQPAVALGEMGIQPWRVSKEQIRTKLATAYPGRTRASLVAADSLTTALGRPNREQVVTTRPPEATTLQALEMTNGETLADILKRGAQNLMADKDVPKSNIVPLLYAKALGRTPGKQEIELGQQVMGGTVGAEGLEDLLWSLTMLPEFQLIY